MNIVENNYYIKDFKYGKISFLNKKQSIPFFEHYKHNDNYQEHINIEFKKYHLSNSNVIDVGANVGLFSVSFSKIDPSCKVHSFEAVKINRTILQNNKILNGLENLLVYDYGLSDETKESNIIVNDDNLASCTFSTHYKFPNSRIETINVKKLDDYNFTNVSFIKVDIQEHEYEFIKGATETLKNNDATVILEIPIRNNREIEIHNKCKILMQSLGYGHYRACINSTKDYIFRKKQF